MFPSAPLRVFRPRAALVVLGTALLLSSTTTAAQASAPVISQVSLKTVLDGNRLTATTAVRSSSRVTVSELGVCVRSTSGRNFDLPRRGPATLGSVPVVRSGQRTLPPGEYTLGTCVRTSAGWRALPGWKKVVVRPVGPGAAPAPPRPTGPAGAWSLRLDSTFAAGGLDRAVWRPSRYGLDGVDEGPFNPDIENALFSSRNVQVQEGVLSMRTTAGGGVLGGRSYGYRSGTVSTEGSFAFGDDSYVEARVRIPRAAGMWPAFWAVPQGDWPPEVDVFEFFDTGTDSRPAFNYHFRDAEGRLQQTGPRRYGDPKVDYREGWHTYGLQRTEGRLVPWLDGVPYPEVGASGLGDTPLFLILNLSVRRTATAPAGQSMDVSHVRAWRQG